MERKFTYGKIFKVHKPLLCVHPAWNLSVDLYDAPLKEKTIVFYAMIWMTIWLVLVLTQLLFNWSCSVSTYTEDAVLGTTHSAVGEMAELDDEVFDSLRPLEMKKLILGHHESSSDESFAEQKFKL
jgi:hypothetical protein